jgi:hypothetical protein
MTGSYLIYDLEIIKAIPPKGDRLEGVEYCGGWTDYEGMGISVGATCLLTTIGASEGDWVISEPRSFTGLVDLGGHLQAHLLTPGLPIGGFNSRKFDDKLLSANGIDLTSGFDILDMVLEAAGWKGRAYWNNGFKYNLATIATANGYEKTLSGEEAPIEWQKGNKEKVIKYCENDVRIEAETLKRLLLGTLIDPNTKQLLKHEGIYA